MMTEKNKPKGSSNRRRVELRREAGSGRLVREVVGNLTAIEAIEQYGQQIEKLTGGTDAAPEVVVLSWSAQRVWIESLERALHRQRAGDEGIFELRAFCPAAELRFVHERAGRGRAVIVREGRDDEGRADADRDRGAVSFGSRITGIRYLLFGEIDDKPKNVDRLDDHMVLTAERVGALTVPGSFEGCSRVAIAAVEYVGSGPGGNAVVIDERLIELQGVNSDA